MTAIWKHVKVSNFNKETYQFHYFSLAECVGVNGEPCIFPFNYHGKTFDKCTPYDANQGKVWCAVAVNEGGDMTSWKDCDSEACKG